MKPNRRTNLLYGRERVLSDYELRQDSFVLNDIYEDRDLQLIGFGNVSGVSRLRIDDEETGCTYTTSIGGSTANFAVQLKH